MKFLYWITFIFLLCLSVNSISQTLPAGFPVWEEVARRSQLLGVGYQKYSFGSRPLLWERDVADSLVSTTWQGKSEVDKKAERKVAKVLPFVSTTVFNSDRPYGWGNYGLQNGVGFQSFVSPGVFLKFHFLEVQLRPEFYFSQNRKFQGFSGDFSVSSNFARFRYWNFGDHPERFSGEFNRIADWGQSYVSLSFGKAQIGLSTQNIWWGPGQFTGLIFSNNARGMKHLFLKTKSPAYIGIGHLEAQIIFARAEDSGLAPTQNQQLNSQYFRPFSGDWRYVNGISLVYNPVFLKDFFIGFNRVFQRFNKDTPKTFSGIIPVFEAFQKERFFQNGNSVIYDQEAQDQLISFFLRFKSEKGKFEIYTEFGKHDHNFNWREFILNPEHARAYLFGFQKLFSLRQKENLIQLRGEIIHQQESINRYIRYADLGVLNTSWLTHYQVRGFTNYGESMGTGIGVGANAQILEASLLKGARKIGVIFKRIENHQDFFYQIKHEIATQAPWIDFSTGVLADFKWNKFNISSSTEFVKATNYQWYGSKKATLDFQGGNRLFTVSANLNLVYSF